MAGGVVSERVASSGGLAELVTFAAAVLVSGGVAARGAGGLVDLGDAAEA